ncbi:hypothetical protein MHK_000641, partial [Candidatus Magnetomorum sp. HK-1]
PYYINARQILITAPEPDKHLTGDLRGLIHIFQTITNKYSPGSIDGVDVNQDDKISIEEALYVFEKIVSGSIEKKTRPKIYLSASEITVIENSAIGLVATVSSQDDIPVTITADISEITSTEDYNDFPEIYDVAQGNQQDFYWVPQTGRGNHTYHVIFNALDQNGLSAI